MARPLRVTDPGLAALPMVRDALAANRDAGLPTGLFPAIKSNPTGGNVAQGVEAYRDGGHDGIVAFGGGSALDAGKAVALMAGQDRPIWDRSEESRVGKECVRTCRSGWSPYP